ncbi:transcriptional regulator [Actinoplanes italicus]|uniref:ArsR family transcriptional regulator n=1 Tax=Actinoplanes italicus TaxID=113567 RepID=A0A2T0K904_9ACTN|nr:metalloregulator ArsR/SmtB family transcription factor [Actinoplanes italicus]PRX19373.1 ArsR family transcriptional regulator [Actinoplanes italicus]GIE30612.1 transcriptional regulator [Actinoplanes italicus]
MRARDNVANASDLQKQAVGDDVIEAATTLLAMLSDPTRLRLAACLLDGEQDVTTLTEAVGAARPAVSQHLGKLRLAGVTRVRREGRRQVYTLADDHVRRLVTEALYTAEHRLPGRPAHHGPPLPRSR